MTNLSIRQKLFYILVSVVLVFVVASNLIMQQFLDNIARQEIVRGLKTSTLAYSRIEEQRRDRIITQVSSIAQTPHLQASLAITGVDPETILFAGEAIKDVAHVPLILLVSSSGKLLADIRNERVVTADLSAMPGMSALTNGDSYYGIWRYHDSFYNVAMSPILSGNQVVGGLVLGDTFNSTEALQLVRDVTGIQVSMLLGGKIVVDGKGVGNSPLVNELRTLYLQRRLDHSPKQIEIKNENYYAVAVPLQGTDGALFFYRAQSEISASIGTFRYLMLVSSGITLILGLALSLWIALKMSRSLIRLTKVAEEYGKGNFEADMSFCTNDEIGHLASAFAALGKDIVISRKSLENSHDYVYNIIEAMSDTLIVVNDDGTIDKVNGATLDILDYTEDKIRTLSFIDLMESSEIILSNCKDLVSNQLALNSSINYKTQAGEAIPMSFSASEMIDETGHTKAIVCVARDRRPVEKLLKEINNAEAASEAKSTFLARMSHELRTPLNAILGFAQIQRSFFSDNATAQQAENMVQITRAGEHLLMLINDILDVVKLEQNQIEIALGNCCLDSVINESISLVELQSVSARITLTYHSTAYWAIANTERLKQVLVNLLTNAIKYNVVGGSVTINVVLTAPSLIDIIIADTGVGISKEEQDAVFEPFTRLTYAEYHEIQGAGVGLALAKFLIQQMNGNITLQSDVGYGSSFRVQLAQGEDLLGVSQHNTPADPQTRLLPEEHIESKILYIEDNHSNRELFRGIFHNYPSCTLLMANTAEKGIEIADVDTPDMIFIDINLPMMDGVSCLKVLKSNPKLTNVTMIALSADAFPGQIEIALEAGFDEYLTKPVDVDQIIDILRIYHQAKNRHLAATN
ncbi:MAG TPA: response regulator [Gammaproteobacteria bacterium]|nr:response regulator [Gammaproteobacteria bacterium]HIL96514.1 response regulator [Pseudomonadales bacterium]